VEVLRAYLMRVVTWFGGEKVSGRKKCQECSVENLASSENHHIERQRSEHGLAALGPVGGGAEGGSEEAFEHTINSFRLPASRFSLDSRKIRGKVYHYRGGASFAFCLVGA